MENTIEITEFGAKVTLSDGNELEYRIPTKEEKKAAKDAQEYILKSSDFVFRKFEDGSSTLYCPDGYGLCAAGAIDKLKIASYEANLVITKY